MNLIRRPIVCCFSLFRELRAFWGNLPSPKKYPPGAILGQIHGSPLCAIRHRKEPVLLVGLGLALAGRSTRPLDKLLDPKQVPHSEAVWASLISHFS